MLQTSLQSSTILMMVAPGAGEQAAIAAGLTPISDLLCAPSAKRHPARLDHPPNDAPPRPPRRQPRPASA